jgi:hypothetical protein
MAHNPGAHRLLGGTDHLCPRSPTFRWFDQDRSSIARVGAPAEEAFSLERVHQGSDRAVARPEASGEIAHTHRVTGASDRRQQTALWHGHGRAGYVAVELPPHGEVSLDDRLDDLTGCRGGPLHDCRSILLR